MDILLRALFAWSRHLTEQREASKSNCVRGLRIPKKTSDLSFLWTFPKEPPQGALSDVLLGILSRHTLSDSLPAWPNVMLMQSSDSVCGWLECPPTSIQYYWALQYFPLPLAWLSQCECASNTFQVTCWVRSRKSNHGFLTHPHSYCLAHPSLQLHQLHSYSFVLHPPSGFCWSFPLEAYLPHVSVLCSGAYFIMKVQNV